MKKISYVITVDENNVRIEKRPIGAIRIGDETEDALIAHRAKTMRWRQMKLPMWFEAVLCWGFKRVWKLFHEVK
ncbi:MAG: hypothetical protein HPY66_2137 [Firmicutes bacterium]|nr:hypothetical protein [Bacillota bacterium]MDI6686878.1 hypothetical protein [Desulfobacterales bacterium]